jgi:hypothetical protein
MEDLGNPMGGDRTVPFDEQSVGADIGGSVVCNPAFVSPNYQVSNDVVVTLGNWVPNGAHVRIYPRQFQEILAIGPEPSFLRGDGGSNVATAAGAPVWLANPFALKPNSLRPARHF